MQLASVCVKKKKFVPLFFLLFPVVVRVVVRVCVCGCVWRESLPVSSCHHWRTALEAPGQNVITGKNNKQKTSKNSSMSLPRLRIVDGVLVKEHCTQRIILRGVNLVSKTENTPEELGFGHEAAQFLQNHAFNVVRLGLSWANVQPYAKRNRLGQLYNHHYLASLKRTVKLLAQYGIYTLIDFHQDAYAAPFGHGFPSWTVKVGGSNLASVGFPLNVFGGAPVADTADAEPQGDTQHIAQIRTGQSQEKKSRTGQTVQTDVDFAFDAFWQNTLVIEGLGVQEHYFQMVAFVVEYFKCMGGAIVGYDPLNEPTPGSLWTEAVADPENCPEDFAHGTPTFDTILTDFYHRLIPRIQEVDPEACVWFEPCVLFALGATTYLPRLPFQNIGFNFHNYDTLSNFERPIRNAQIYAKLTADVPLLCSEFGATTNANLVEKIMSINNTFQLSAIYWTLFNNPRYVFWPNSQLPPSPTDQGLVLDFREALKSPNTLDSILRVLSQPFPCLIEGDILKWRWQWQKGRLRLVFRGTLAHIRGVPRRARIRVKNATYRRLQTHHRTILIQAQAHSPPKRLITVTITLRNKPT